jgi:hypothetical protein
MTEKAMQYKTIVLALLQQRTEMHEQLRRERMLLIILETYAYELKLNHEAWKLILSAIPGYHESQIPSLAMEIAIKALEDRLPPVSPGHETLSLDEAMAFINNIHTLPD